MEKIAAALVKAQMNFEKARKTSSNPHFRSMYASLDTCVDAVLDALNNEGIFLTQPQHECSDGVVVETMFIHSSGEVFSAGRLHVPAAKQDPQGYGSALTYARRYSLLAACGIAPEDDDGNAATEATKKAQKTAQVTFISQNQVDTLTKLARDAGADLGKFCEYFRVPRLSELPATQFDVAVKMLEKKRKATTTPEPQKAADEAGRPADDGNNDDRPFA